MSRKNTLQYQVSSGKSLATSFQTAPTVIRYLDNLSYQINVTTADSAGTFAVQGSNDYEVNEVTGNQVSPGTWVDLNLSGGTPFVAGADDSILIDLNQLPFTAIRLAYISTVAGTGTCDIFLTARQLGG